MSRCAYNLGRAMLYRTSAACLLALVVGFGAYADAQKPATGGPGAPAPPTLDVLLKSLPVVAAPVLDEPRAEWLVTVPLACLDELQPRPATRPYFWEATFHPVDGYDKIRAFYGCNDWHSAVNATWTLAVVLKRLPDLPVGRLIREKLADHLGKTNLDGELAFFKEAGAFGFSATFSPANRDYDGGYMPTHVAPRTEFLEMASVLADYNRGSLEWTTGKHLERLGMDFLLELAKTSGRPVNFNGVAQSPLEPDGWRKILAWAEKACREAVVLPVNICVPLDFEFTMDTIGLFDNLPAWKEATLGRLEERKVKLGDAARRDATDPIVQRCGMPR